MFAGPPRLVVGQRLLLEAGEEVVADVVLDVARGADDDAAHQEQEEAADERGPEQQARIDEQLPPRDGLVQVVDGELEDPRSEQLERGRRDDTDEADDEGAPVTIDVGKKPFDRRRQHRSSAYMKKRKKGARP